MRGRVSHRHVESAPFRTPFGAGTVVTAGGVLLEVRLPPYGAVPEHLSEQAPGADGRPDSGAHTWAAELEGYFEGRRLTWTAEEVELAPLGLTPFRREVYRVLLGIPPGQTVSYGELAALAGRPGAARAVGTAMAENPIAVVVPCHRVVRGDGSLGRYGDDDRWKAYLLELEGSR